MDVVVVVNAAELEERVGVRMGWEGEGGGERGVMQLCERERDSIADRCEGRAARGMEVWRAWVQNVQLGGRVTKQLEAQVFVYYFELR